MWRVFLTILQSVFSLSRDLEDNRREIKELNEKVFALASAVRSLSEKVESNVQLEAAERKTLVLQLQNELLRSEKTLRSDRGHKRIKLKPKRVAEK